MIDTAVEGEVGSVTGAATWLRETLSANLTTAADDCARGRSVAGREWEGTDATAYSDYARRVLSLTDEHAARVGRAANAFDAYGARLSTMKSTMRGFRARAVAGGLQVSGDLIAAPPEVPATVVEPGSPAETQHLAAVAKVDLYNTLSDETTTARTEFDLWIQANLVPEVTDAEDSSRANTFITELRAQLPSVTTSMSASLTGLSARSLSDKYRDAAREVRRKSRVSGDPRVQGKGGPKSDDLLGKSRWLGKAGKFLGPVGIGISVAFGIQEARETGDWKRPALTVGTGLAVAGGITLIAAAAVTSPVWVTGAVIVVGATVVGALASAGAGLVYDHWDDITGWTGDRWDDTKDLAGDAWDGAKDVASGAKDKVGGAWDAVTPW